jgi:hypothetical protein
VPGATVTVKNLNSGYTRDVQTGDDGYYIIPLLPVGNYELRVEKEGFSMLVQSNIPVKIGEAAVLNLALQIGAATQVVEVKGAAPLVETPARGSPKLWMRPLCASCLSTGATIWTSCCSLRAWCAITTARAISISAV